MLSERTKPSFTSLVAFVLLLLPVSYVLSYAPYLACFYEDPPADSWETYGCQFCFDEEYTSHNHHAFFQPVEWLIDRTLLQEPLMRWGTVWGVGVKMRYDATIRCFERSGEI